MKGAALKLLKTVAPMIGTAIAGPAGGVAANVLADMIQVPRDQLESTIEAGDPDIIGRITEVQDTGEFQRRMAELGVDLERIHAEDRQDARAYSLATGQIPQIALAFVLVGGYILIMIQLLNGGLVIPDANSQLIAGFLGVLTGGVTACINFFLGSSSGSKRKTELQQSH